MKVTLKHARRLEILRHNYELMKDLALQLGIKQSAFTQTDTELNALQKKINKKLSGVIDTNKKA
jgi:DNA-binding MarR family transcriptional regulator